MSDNYRDLAFEELLTVNDGQGYGVEAFETFRFNSDEDLVSIRYLGDKKCIGD